MPQLSNERQERFAQALATNMRMIDAYRHAGYTNSPSSASQLSGQPHIRERVQELLDERLNAMNAMAEEDGDFNNEPISREWLIRQLQHNIKKAQASGQFAAANKAIDMLIQLTGLGIKAPAAGQEPAPARGEPKSGDKMTAILDRLNEIAPDETPEEEDEDDPFGSVKDI